MLMKSLLWRLTRGLLIVMFEAVYRTDEVVLLARGLWWGADFPVAEL